MKKILSKFNTFTKKREIQKWCRYWLVNGYTINDDLTISSQKSVNCPVVPPFKFKEVFGDFRCKCVDLKDFTNFPDRTHGRINISTSKITSLDNLPSCTSVKIESTDISNLNNVSVPVYSARGCRFLFDVPENNIPINFQNTPIYNLVCMLERHFFENKRHLNRKEIITYLHDFDVLDGRKFDMIRYDDMSDFIGVRKKSEYSNRFISIDASRFGYDVISD